MMGTGAKDKKSVDALISVVMPAYNAEITIDQAIQSVIKQTYKNIELIVIDDGSNDKTVEKVNAYTQKDSRVKILHNRTNAGVAVSRNRGVKAARGEWIAFLDSDDAWLPEKLEKQYKRLLNAPKCSICFTGSSFINEQGNYYSYTLSVPSQLTYYDLLKQNLISCSSVLVKKEIIEKFPMTDDPMIHEDLLTWLKILENGSYAIGVDEPLLIYRIQKNSKSGNKMRAAKMQWKTYEAAGIHSVKRLFFFASYAWRNIKKYLLILKS